MLVCFVLFSFLFFGGRDRLASNSWSSCLSLPSEYKEYRHGPACQGLHSFTFLAIPSQKDGKKLKELLNFETGSKITTEGKYL
jgi:hypothetical protein